MPKEIVERHLVENAGVKLNPGSSYRGAGHMRTNLGLARPLLEEEALGRIRQAAERV